MNIIKVSATSRTAAVAGAIAGVMRDHRYAEVQAIGAGAVNQAVKAIVLAKGYLVNDGIDVICVPEFVDVDIDGKVRTAVRLVVTPRGEDTKPEEIFFAEELPEQEETLEEEEVISEEEEKPEEEETISEEEEKPEEEETISEEEDISEEL